MNNCIISVFFEVINSSATSMCSIIIKVTLRYSIHMRISDEAEHVQSVSYFHKIIVRVICCGVFKGRQASHLPCRNPPSHFKGTPQGISHINLHVLGKNLLSAHIIFSKPHHNSALCLQMSLTTTNVQVLCFARAPNSNCIM